MLALDAPAEVDVTGISIPVTSTERGSHTPVLTKEKRTIWIKDVVIVG